MDPIQITVSVELGPKTTQLLRAFLSEGPAPEAKAPAAAEPDMPDFTQPTAAAPEKVPEESEEISDATLRGAVKAAKDKAGAKAVRDIFTSFGITSSVECPAERRSELVAALKNLQ